MCHGEGARDEELCSPLWRRLGSWGGAILELLSQISSLLFKVILSLLVWPIKVDQTRQFRIVLGILLVLSTWGCREDLSSTSSNSNASIKKALDRSTPPSTELVSEDKKEGKKIVPNQIDPSATETVEQDLIQEQKGNELLQDEAEKLIHKQSVSTSDVEKSSLPNQDSEEKNVEEKNEASKKPSKCRRGIHKGAKHCQVKRYHINIRQINRGIKHKDLRIIGDQQNITKNGRKALLELLGDWRSKETCGYGYTFNYEYTGKASWKMYDCYVQDRLLWYLYLIGHHFDSEIQVLSGLRSDERKSSRHHNGHAVDFRVAGVQPKEVWEYCKKTFPLVGIGYYPKAQFVHLDVGRDSHQAYWIDSSGSGESAQYKNGVSQVQKGRAQKSQAGMIKSIKGMLLRHYDTFKEMQASWLKRKKKRELRAKKKRAKKKASKKSLPKKSLKKRPKKSSKTPSKQ